MPRTARALLPHDLPLRVGHFAPCLGVVGSGASRGKLPLDDALQDVRSDLDSEHAIVQFHFAPAAVTRQKGFDLGLHGGPSVRR